MHKFLMRLVQTFGAANPDIHKIIERYGDAEAACAAIDKGEFGFRSKAEKENADFVTADKIDKVIEYCNKRDIKLLSIYDKEYPALLKEIYNPPVLLFFRGSLDCLKRQCITVVGSRDITPYMEKLAFRVCTDLSKSGITIVSGMAHGVDSTAHNACTALGNPTVGVLACGISCDYPRGSDIMRNNIILSGGAYITELMPNVTPVPEYFRARNRIMAGLSGGTAVFQAGKKSGALITAEYAVQEGRDVFCVPPPNIFDERYSGVVDYLRDGAIPLINHDDILKFYEENY